MPAPRKTPTKPRADGPEILANQAADRLGLTPQAIGMWCSKPGAPVRKAGGRVYVRWPDFARWREEQLVGNAKRSEPAGNMVVRRQEAEARSAEIAAELGELKLASARGDVVAVADYEAALGTVLDRLTARLRAMPVRLSHLGADVEAAAEAEAERIVVELHAWDEDVSDETEPEQQEAA